MVKKILAMVLLFSIFSSSPVYAGSWKNMNNKNFKNINIEIKKDAIYKNQNYVFYTVHFKSKKIGDYINVIRTNCSDFTSNILMTSAYDDSFKPYYEDYEIDESNNKAIDSTSILYDSATYACMAKDNYSKSSKSSKGESKVKKVFKGIGEGLLMILVLPFALIGAIFSL